MDLLALRDFVAVAQEGGFGAASRALGEPKSTISKRIQALEKDLGVRLMERTTRALRLTAEGALLLDRARRLTMEADELRALLSGRDSEPKGPLRVACTALFGQVFMGSIAAAYTRAWPQTTLEVIFIDRPVDLIEEGFDCAIRVMEDGEQSLISRTFARARAVVVASPDVAERCQSFTHPEQLNTVPSIGFAPNGVQISWPLQRGNENHAFTPRGPLVLGGLSAMRDAALEGAGVTALPEFLVHDDLEAGRLVRILPEWMTEERALRLVWPANRHLSARVRAFIDLVVDSFQGRRLS